MPPIPCIIWAVARVGSTALARALRALNEPFQLSDGFRSVEEIRELCTSHYSIKHLYEECPDEQNIALAQAANEHGYRHIRLMRCNEFARLVSRGIAAHQDAWTPANAITRFEDLKAGRTKLRPLDVQHLVKIHQMAVERWRTVTPHVGPLLTVRFEDITSANRERRHHAFRHIAAFLHLPSIEPLERIIATSGQNTKEVWEFVPNLQELRTALVAGGAF